MIFYFFFWFVWGVAVQALVAILLSAMGLYEAFYGSRAFVLGSSIAVVYGTVFGFSEQGREALGDGFRHTLARFAP